MRIRSYDYQSNALANKYNVRAYEKYSLFPPNIIEYKRIQEGTPTESNGVEERRRLFEDLASDDS